jgi:MFS transporter, AAHS family, 4-hydroxybenzoate transporter
MDMAQAAVIDVSSVIETQRRGGFLVTFIVLACFMTFFDGYDLVAIAFAAPSMIRDWHLERAAFAIVFSAGTFGMTIGCIVFGFISDRYGRKPTAVTTVVMYGLFSLLTVFAANIEQVVVLRFLTGMGIGALMPAVYTMAVEFVPRQLRSTTVTIVVAAFNVGAMLAGIIAASLIPRFGWTVVYWLAGIAPLGIAVAMILLLPESLRFLVSKNRPASEIAKVLRRIDPAIVLPPGARFIDGSKMALSEADAGKSTIGMLFRGRLGVMTLLLWASYFFCAVAVFFINSWTPTLAEALGVAPRYAALALTTFSLGTLVASLAMMRFLDWYGAIIVPIFPLLACPAFVLLGLAKASDMGFIALLFLTGVGIGGGLNGLHSVVGLFYPNECRATGVSWAVAASRVGGIVGPGLAGLLLALGLSVKGIFLVAIIPTLLFAACALGLGLFHTGMMRAEKSEAISPAGSRRFSVPGAERAG